MFHLITPQIFTAVRTHLNGHKICFLEKKLSSWKLTIFQNNNNNKSEEFVKIHVGQWVTKFSQENSKNTLISNAYLTGLSS